MVKVNKPDLNELAQKIHADAVEHGYWDIKEPPTDTLEGLDEANLAKIHCELSEAVEQDCKGFPMEWYYCMNLGNARGADSHCLERGKQDIACKGRECCKPEGIAVELADFVIAFMDYCRHKRIIFPEDGNRIAMDTLPKLVNFCHKNITHLADSFGWGEIMPEVARKPYQNALAAEIILTVADFVQRQGWDFWGIVAEKMEYNKTRQRLHGKRY